MAIYNAVMFNQHTEGKQMKFIISAQHLYGNDPEGFAAAAWLEALEAEYRKIVAQWFPRAEIEVTIDAQHACGYSRDVSVYVEDDDGVSVSDQRGMVSQIEQAENDLYDRRGEEFFT